MVQFVVVLITECWLFNIEQFYLQYKAENFDILIMLETRHVSALFIN